MMAIALPKDYGLGVAFTVPGRPVAQALVKRFGRNGFVGFDLSPEVRAYQKAVASIARRACRVPLRGPVRIVLRIFVRHEKGGNVPDLTGVQVCVENAIKKIAFEDDVQTRSVDNWMKVVDTAAEERVEVRVRKLAEGEWPDD